MAPIVELEILDVLQSYIQVFIFPHRTFSLLTIGILPDCIDRDIMLF